MGTPRFCVEIIYSLSLGALETRNDRVMHEVTGSAYDKEVMNLAIEL